MIEAIEPRRIDRLSVGVVAVERVILLMQFLKLVLGHKPVESRSISFRIDEVVGGAVNRVFSEVEVTREDGVVGVIVACERFDFSKP